MRLQKPPAGFSFSQPFARRWRAVRRRSHGRPLAAVCERMENRSLLSGMPMLAGASSAEVTDLVDVSSIHGESCFSVPDDRLQHEPCRRSGDSCRQRSGHERQRSIRAAFDASTRLSQERPACRCTTGSGWASHFKSQWRQISTTGSKQTTRRSTSFGASWGWLSRGARRATCFRSASY